jgi:hypothetical protein
MSGMMGGQAQGQQMPGWYPYWAQAKAKEGVTVPAWNPATGIQGVATSMQQAETKATNDDRQLRLQEESLLFQKQVHADQMDLALKPERQKALDEAARQARIGQAGIGRASTILTGGMGVTGPAPLARSVLLGR